MTDPIELGKRIISIHTLRMEGDVSAILAVFCIKISIHTLRMEGDVVTFPRPTCPRNFNPHPPHGG